MIQYPGPPFYTSSAKSPPHWCRLCACFTGSHPRTACGTIDLYVITSSARAKPALEVVAARVEENRIYHTGDGWRRSRAVRGRRARRGSLAQRPHIARTRVYGPRCPHRTLRLKARPALRANPAGPFAALAGLAVHVAPPAIVREHSGQSRPAQHPGRGDVRPYVEGRDRAACTA